MNKGLNLDMTEEKPVRKRRNSQTANKKSEALAKKVATLKTENKQLSSKVKKLQKELDKKPVQINISGNKYSELLKLFTDLKSNKDASTVSIAKTTPLPKNPTVVPEKDKVEKLDPDPSDFQEQPDDETTIEPEDDQSFDEADEKEEKIETKTEAKVSSKNPEPDSEVQDEEEKVVLPNSDDDEEDGDGLDDFFDDYDEDDAVGENEKSEDDEIKIDNSKKASSASIKSEPISDPKKVEEVEPTKSNSVEQSKPEVSDNDKNDQKESESNFRELVNMDKLNLSENDIKDPISDLFADDDESISDEINSYFSKESDTADKNSKIKETPKPVVEKEKEKEAEDKKEDAVLVKTPEPSVDKAEPTKEISNTADTKLESNKSEPKISLEASSNAEDSTSIKENDSIGTRSLDPKEYDDGSDDDLMGMDDLI